MHTVSPSRYIEQGSANPPEPKFPSTWIHESRDYCEVDLGLPIMEFRLTYQGPLYADRGPDDQRQSRLIHKHAIRTNFHRQLSELWRLDYRLKDLAHERFYDENGTTKSDSVLRHLQQTFRKDGIEWVPLVNDIWGVACGLNILFLRHEPKGGIVQSGDLDNRIATLFDALAIPKANELPDDLPPQNADEPFFCLLSDDKFIAEFRVTSDRLLTPNPKGSDADVHLIIEVRTFIADHEKARMTLGKFVHD